MDNQELSDVDVHKQIKEDEFIDNTIASMTFFEAILQAWQRHIEEHCE